MPISQIVKKIFTKTAVIILIGLSASQCPWTAGSILGSQAYGVEATSLNPTLVCENAPEVKAPMESWSKVSICPKGFVAVGLARVDLQGPHNPPTIHVNDFICENDGCKVYCIGSSCHFRTRCCAVKMMP